MLGGGRTHIMRHMSLMITDYWGQGGGKGWVVGVGACQSLLSISLSLSLSLCQTSKEESTKLCAHCAGDSAQLTRVGVSDGVITRDVQDGQSNTHSGRTHRGVKLGEL